MGRVLGDRYRVISRLGEGGMGTVYLCEHAVLQRRFAVKVLRPELATDGELVDRFRNEAIAASRIGQENVVDVVDFGAEADGALYYVMEALDGKGLGAVIADEGAIAVPRALDLLEQICHALSAAHARGVVHRDVKPDNVFLVLRPGGGERVKLIDFGISRVPGTGTRITRVGAIIGTPEYMAPEQASGDAIDHRADVYAVGVLAYEMLTGALPLEAATPHATIEAHRTRTPEAPSRRVVGIPPEVDALVLRALAKRREDRFGSMDELAAELARIRMDVSSEPAWRRAGVGAATHGGTGRPSLPRGATVALAEEAGGPARAFRRGMLAIAVLAGATAALAAGWVWREAERGKGATSAPTAISIPGPTSPASGVPTPTSTGRPLDRAAPQGAVLFGNASQPGAPPHAEGARAPRPKTARAPSPAGAAAGSELKDPYGDDEKLKDPFR